MAVPRMDRPARTRLNRAFKRVVNDRAAGRTPATDDVLIIVARLHDMMDSPDYFTPAEQAEFDDLRQAVDPSVVMA